MWRSEAQGLRLLVADNKTGYYGVYHHPGYPKPYEAQVSRGGTMVSLGYFATAEEAALCVARSPEGRAAAKEAAAAPPTTSEEARQQADAEDGVVEEVEVLDAEEVEEEMEDVQMEVVEVVKVVEVAEGRPKVRRRNA